MKIAYLYQLDASDPGVQSGRPASILRNLTELGATVQPVFALGTRVSRLSTFKKALYRLMGRYYRGDRDPQYLSAIASEFDRQMQGKTYDMAFSPGSEAVSHLNISRPIAFCADATFANMIDYYWDFSSLPAEYIRKGHEQEAAALHRAALAIYPSEWAARSAIDYYRTDPRKVFVIPFGANLGSENERESVYRWIAEREFDELRLLFVGKSWRRKGGDLVLETARHLVARGHRVKLDIVCGEVPHRLNHPPWIRHHGLLDPGVPESRSILCGLFKAAHFVFIPSRAEAYGMTFAEASAFGVPAIGTETGGIPSVVHNAVNGFLLPLSSGAAEFSDLIASLVSNHDQYRLLCQRSFGEFEQSLNWKTFCARFLDLAGQCCGQLAHKSEDCA
jgi:glycosyltransferase involved in cell wall biosynthesis